MKNMIRIPVGLILLIAVMGARPALAQFTDITAGLNGVHRCSVAWGDYDNDGDLDVLLTGQNPSDDYITRIHRNDLAPVAWPTIGAGIPGVSGGSVAWGDYDNDGDLDILIAGSASGGSFSRVYRNNGGTFTDIGAGLPPLSSGCSVAWGDYDNDGDLDILLAGYSTSVVDDIMVVYQNDGGVFTDIAAGLMGLDDGSAAWGDYDNDGDLDILAAGDQIALRVYQNDGGTFNDVVEGLAGYFAYSSVAWGDYDNDGDLDFILAGNGKDGRTTRIYQNNGGIFTDIEAGLIGVDHGSVAWGDYDNDGDLDILLAGQSWSPNWHIIRVYRNDGGGVFTWYSGAGLIPVGVQDCSVAWGDYDNDGDLDILFAGETYSGTRISRVYRNDGGTVNTVPGTPYDLGHAFKSTTEMMLTWTSAGDAETPTAGLSYNLRIGTTPGGSDVFPPMANTSSGYRRVAQLGNASQNEWMVSFPGDGTYYWSVQALDGAFAGSPFSAEGSFDFIFPPFEDIGAGLEGVSKCEDGGSFHSSNSVAWGDYDNDGDLDILLSGHTNSGTRITQVYQNDGGSFSDIGAGLVGVDQSSMAWGDYDNDGDLDILLSGLTNSFSCTTKVYQNDGGSFSDLGAALEGVRESSVAWGDYDNDGDLDILLAGNTNSARISRVYRNDGGSFTDIGAGLEGVKEGSVAWGDYDNDGDLDILLTGMSDGPGRISRVYRNDNGSFIDIVAGLEGAFNSSAAWGDYDNDGDLDILLTGYTYVPIFGPRTCHIYRNDGGSFIDIDAGLEGVDRGSVAWGDYENDGDLDILLTGYTDSSTRISRLYQNDGGTFTDVTVGLEGVDRGSVMWGDYDNDGDLDILLTGYTGSTRISRIYRNRLNFTNTIPNAPASLTTDRLPHEADVTFSWAAASDAETPATGLSYNLRIGTTPGGSEILSPLADAGSGYRRVVQYGNANENTAWQVTLPGYGVYYWSVQAVDGAFAGSDFAPEETVVISDIPVCDVTPTSIDFGTVFVGSWKDTVFVITNVGGGTLSGTVSESCPDYEIVGGGGAYNLTGGQAIGVTIRFSPTVAGGPYECTIETGVDCIESVICTGMGEDPPVCEITPTSLDFGTVKVGVSRTESFRIRNTGGGVLAGTVTIDCPHYEIAWGGGAYNLTAGQSRYVGVRYEPTVEGGPHVCTVETGSNCLDDVFCTGMGQGPICEVDPTSLDFGVVFVGSSKDTTFTIWNDGGGILSGSVSLSGSPYYSIVSTDPPDDPYNLGIFEALLVTVRFSPGIAGGPYGCTIETGTNCLDDVVCTGMGDDPPACEITPTSLDLGTVFVGSSKDTTFTIKNTGGGTLTGSVSALCAEHYSIVSTVPPDDPYNLAHDEELVVTVRFQPTTGGTHGCTIETGDDLCSDVSCTGVGDDGPICEIIPESLDFETVLVGSWKDTTFAITNSGGGVLSGSVSESCSYFSIVSTNPPDDPYNLAHNESLVVAVRFEPTVGGTHNCTIETGDALCSDVTCTGVGEDPVCEIAPSSLDFGTVYVGSSMDKTFAIKNTGGGILSGSVVAPCSHYSIESTDPPGDPYALAHGESLVVVVRFEPTAAGTHSCMIETGDALCSDVSCSGEGEGPACVVSPTILDFGALEMGSTRDTTFIITNTGGGTLIGNVGEECFHFSLESGGGPFALFHEDTVIVTVRFTSPWVGGVWECAIETGVYLCSDVTLKGISYSCSTDTLFYVDTDASGVQDGSSWTSAWRELRDALTVASVCPAITEIWVAEGTYMPTANTDRAATFQLRDSLAIYGGFAGVETQLIERDVIGNQTVLSGDIGVMWVNSDNSYHVVTASGANSSAILDGFVIVKGNANGGGEDDHGGGIYNSGGNATFTNLWLEGNSAVNFGDGMYNSSGSPIIRNAFILDEMYNNNGSNPTITNAAILYKFRSDDSSPMVYNTILWNPTAGVVTNTGTSSPSFRNSLVMGSGGSSSWDLSFGTDLGNNIDDDPLFVDFAGDNFRLTGGSPAINTGDNAAPNLPATDIEGNPRIGNVTVDMGVYESQRCAERIYVDKDAAGAGDGTSWIDAFTELYEALAWTISCTGNTEIWVAEGVYMPTSDTTRAATFEMRDSLAIYGGFDGTETLLSERDWAANVTILSGDIGVVGVSTDNSYHVVTANGTNSTAVLDGFTVTAGRADGSSGNDDGGGIVANGGSPRFANLIISNNYALDLGGGMYNASASSRLSNVTFEGNEADDGGGMTIRYAGSDGARLVDVRFIDNAAATSGGGLQVTTTNPTLENVTFIGNQAPWGGGMRASYGASPAITNALFLNNTAGSGGGGGGIFNSQDGEPVLTNVTFHGNSGGVGGGIYAYTGSPVIVNVIMWGDSAVTSGDEIYNYDGASTVISYSLIEGCGGSGGGWNASVGTDGGNNIDADPLFIAAPGNLRLGSDSPAIDAGDSLAPNLPATDLDGNPRIIGATVDMGAYEDPWIATQPVACTVSPSYIHFDRALVGSSLDTSFVIKNVGRETVDGNVGEACSYYTVESGGGPFSLARDESLVVSLRYTPTEAGLQRCLIETGSSECNRLVLVADGSGGLQVLDASDPAAPTLAGSYYYTPGINFRSVFVAGNHAFVAQYGTGLKVIDISNPAAPTLTGSCDTPGFASGVFVSGNYAFVADENLGLQVINVNDPTNPTLVGTYDTPGVALGIYVSDGYAYVADWDFGLQVIEISDPTNPTLAGTYDTPDGARAVYVSGNHAFVADGTAGLQVIDISNTAAPTLTGSYDTPGNARAVCISDGYAFVGDSESGLQVIDVSNPAAPTLTGTYDTPGNVQGVFVDGNYAYATDAYYGLYVFDVLDPSNPDSVGLFDTPGYPVGVTVVPGGDVVCTGYAGYAYALIDSIVDVPDDQGGWVRIYFMRSYYDHLDEVQYPIDRYDIHRWFDNPAFAASVLADGKTITDNVVVTLLNGEKVQLAKRSSETAGRYIEYEGRYFLVTDGSTTSAPQGLWEVVGNVSAQQQVHYIRLAPTLGDSLETLFYISAHTTTPAVYFDSPVDTGYSVDNIAPGVPGGFAVAYNTGSGNQLTWDTSPEPDFQYYRVYRGDSEDFVPGPSTLVHETATEGWTDPEYDGWNVHYKITALDYAGNESDAGSPETTTGIAEPRIPKTFALYQNVPNPFNPSTVIMYDVPESGGHVTLRIYDVTGRLVRTLVNGVETPGEKRVTWNGRNNHGNRVATGVYFYRMTAPGFEMTKKMVLIQ